MTELRAGPAYVARLQELMGSLPDLERAATRAYYKKTTPFELVQLLNSVLQTVDVFHRVADAREQTQGKGQGLLHWYAKYGALGVA